MKQNDKYTEFAEELLKAIALMKEPQFVADGERRCATVRDKNGTDVDIMVKTINHTFPKIFVAGVAISFPQKCADKISAAMNIRSDVLRKEEEQTVMNRFLI